MMRTNYTQDITKDTSEYIDRLGSSRISCNLTAKTTMTSSDKKALIPILLDVLEGYNQFAFGAVHVPLCPTPDTIHAQSNRRRIQHQHKFLYSTSIQRQSSWSS